MEADPIHTLYNQPVDCCKEVLSAAYVMGKTGEMGNISADNYNIAKGLRECFFKNKNLFELIAEVEVFDDSVIYIYKRTNL